MKRVQVDEKTPRLREVLAQIIADPMSACDVVIAAAELVIADEYFNLWFRFGRKKQLSNDELLAVLDVAETAMDDVLQAWRALEAARKSITEWDASQTAYGRPLSHALWSKLRTATACLNEHVRR